MAAVATAAVAILPTSSLATAQSLFGDMPLIVDAAIAMTISLVVSVVVSKVWARHSGTSAARFSELMLWSWWRHKRLEGRIESELLLLEDEGGSGGTREDQLERLNRINRALEFKDAYTRGHTRRVERHVYRTAAAMELAPLEIAYARRAAALHDVGKILVPLEILHKDGPLTTDERKRIQEHPVTGAQMLAGIVPDPIVAAVRHHHERIDGKGYPDGIAGTQLPLAARLIAVGDAFDAMTSSRSYRASLKPSEAMRRLEEGRGSQFDGAVIDAFVRSLPRRTPAAAGWAMLGIGRAVFGELARAVKLAGLAAATPAVALATSAAVAVAPAAPALIRAVKPRVVIAQPVGKALAERHRALSRRPPSVLPAPASDLTVETHRAVASADGPRSSRESADRLKTRKERGKRRGERSGTKDGRRDGGGTAGDDEDRTGPRPDDDDDNKGSGKGEGGSAGDDGDEGSGKEKSDEGSGKDEGGGDEGSGKEKSDEGSGKDEGGGDEGDGGGNSGGGDPPSDDDGDD